MLNVRLEPHPSGRSQAVATRGLVAGSLIISFDALTTVLLPQEKGQRCDTCHMSVADVQAYFYCSTKCQNLQWQSHHKRICKQFNKYTSSLSFQALAPHEKLDALLLSHLVAHLDGADPAVSEDPLNTICPVPPIAYSSPRIPASEVRDLHAKFGNNNFVTLSHLTTLGHGIYPLASRLFNHSCLPNASQKYIMSPSTLPKMEIVALRDISPDEEICLTYLDPALLQARQQIFRLSYGFECRCTSCLFFEKVGPIPTPPTDADVAETFRNASHDGPHALALSSGQTLLALYRLIYPPNYPQIGMHLLELAKTSWNYESVVKRECRTYLNKAKEILQILGPEGDEDGPQAEINTLESVLEED
ncbi:hypothetical protein C8R46DRAFT_1174602 [Mycena filopes]|nr:hypothetical protein C8R46DRAFT_1174602 [Mycena filopes]